MIFSFNRELLRDATPNKNVFVIDKQHKLCYSTRTLCTAYKSTVQTEQTVIAYHGVGSQKVTVEFSTHGTVVTNTDSWVFLCFLENNPTIE